MLPLIMAKKRKCLDNHVDGKFKNEKEFFMSLAFVKPCDLRDETTMSDDAIKFCKTILGLFDHVKDFIPNQDQLALKLYRLGACEHNKAARKFIEMKGVRVEDLITIDRNIQFPLSVFTQILNTSNQSYEFFWNLMQSTDLFKSWINAQSTEHTIDNGLTM